MIMAEKMTMKIVREEMKYFGGIFLVAVVLGSSLVLSQETKVDKNGNEYRASIDQWHAGRIKNLQKEQGWLTLVALEWLKEGKNRVEGFGTVEIIKGKVTATVESGTAAVMNNSPFTTGLLKPNEDQIRIGAKIYLVIERSGAYAVRVWDTASKQRLQFAGIDRFPVDPKWKITAEWRPYPQPKPVVVETVIPGFTQNAVAPGIAVFTVNGKEYRLEPTAEPGDEEYFFVFGDQTNGKLTYGGGRYLYAAAPKEGKIVLDFNKSYNPPCVFTDYATCPVPTKNNRLTLRIEAGEKNYKK